MQNSADPDQLASDQKPIDLDLHCLQRQSITTRNYRTTGTVTQVIDIPIQIGFD